MKTILTIAVALMLFAGTASATVVPRIHIYKDVPTSSVPEIVGKIWFYIVDLFYDVPDNGMPTAKQATACRRER